MGGPSDMPMLQDALQRLGANREAMPWEQRRECARMLMAAFKAGGIVDREAVLVPLLNLLAADSKWEVRKAIADDLHLVRQVDYDRLAEQLCQDANSFVRKAAENSGTRRRKARMALKQQAQGLDLVLEQFQWLRDYHGEDVARVAMQIGEAYHMALTGSVAHHMKNYLSVLQGWVTMLQKQVTEGQADPAVLAEMLDKIASILGCHEHQVRQMLTYARSRTAPKDGSTVPLEAVVSAVVDRLRDARAGHAAVIEIDVQKDLWVAITRAQIEEAVFNILENAVAATAGKAGRRVTVTGKAVNGSEVSLAIQDNGGGISARDLAEQKLFVPGRTTKRGGSGLGLVIARNYVEAHEGDLIFESEPGVGTTVTILLPRAKAPGAGNA